MKRILIFGGAGLLAINWARVIRNDWLVTLSLHKQLISLQGVKTIQINLDDFTSLLSSVEKIKPDVILNTVGLADVEACESKPDLAEYVNVFLATQISRASQILNIPIIHISSDMLFDGSRGHITENDVPLPVNNYGKTKLLSEMSVQEICDKSLIIRTNFFGWGTDYRKSFSDFIIDNLRDNKKINLYSDVLFTPIYIDELVKVSHELIDKGCFGTFNVFGKTPLSKYAFGSLLQKKFLLPDLIKKSFCAGSQDSVTRPLDMTMSVDKVESVLNRSMGDIDYQIEQLYLGEDFRVSKELRMMN